ncbi:ErmE/ErmH/ErmO/ErmR family 23S rRNA (adenine(2058)-N(6))-methyltransferase [Streptomyces sp. CMB-StM0423]|uniref:ErmE/ErmH/ErmO/ErmR family 23S rRNA (adenine(2058)-N(6))-methyltransferase n=1 Tax=Streptomyces sp. CMB-StM0423 TaxID=2059884 RepID=UPI000C7069D6|nr:ErmE/ErmH/ErmO/ErmR family 23S rRNA (adenine(2058)-N(6))-methyltransferase [Streptomyces sp. CMB-StM0423]AUH39825.1 ErmE/ErmH/ErmO/ErmR family 23S rRNA (adenine(2058)-N(6))-methyltransferase [Streptomyces sp. CMB-StM0423]
MSARADSDTNRRADARATTGGNARTNRRRGSPEGARDTGRSRSLPRSLSLSQNFLAGPAVARRVVRLAAPEAGCGLVVEIGAGTGTLTEALAPHCRELIAYEIDRRLLPGLRTRLAAHPHVRVVGQDFLASRPPREPFAVVGNVPYARTSEIVDWCLRAPRLESATFVTQLEYARKRTGDYGRWSLLTVRTWPWHEWRLRGRVPRESFRPVPRVDSAVLRLDRRGEPLLPRTEEAAYRRMVETGFGGAGGTLYASLRRAGYSTPRLTTAFRTADLPNTTVVAYATPSQWLTLHKTLH